MENKNFSNFRSFDRFSCCSWGYGYCLTSSDIHNKIYYVGGYAHNRIANELWTLDIESEIWSSSLTSLPAITWPGCMIDHNEQNNVSSLWVYGGICFNRSNSNSVNYVSNSVKKVIQRVQNGIMSQI